MFRCLAVLLIVLFFYKKDYSGVINDYSLETTQNRYRINGINANKKLTKLNLLKINFLTPARQNTIYISLPGSEKELFLNLPLFYVWHSKKLMNKLFTKRSKNYYCWIPHHKNENLLLLMGVVWQRRKRIGGDFMEINGRLQLL